MSEKSPTQLPKKCSISVTGATYELLRTRVTSTSVQSFIEKLIISTLDDPKARARLLADCGVTESAA